MFKAATRDKKNNRKKSPQIKNLPSVQSDFFFQMMVLKTGKKPFSSIYITYRLYL